MPKAYGRDIKEFYNSDWNGYYHDHSEIKTHNEDGTWAIQDGEKYDTARLGLLVPEAGLDVGGNDVVSFTSAFNRWMKVRDTETIVITVPKSKRAEVIVALAGVGVKI